jgi:hypothetical protein
MRTKRLILPASLHLCAFVLDRLLLSWVLDHRSIFFPIVVLTAA